MRLLPTGTLTPGIREQLARQHVEFHFAGAGEYLDVPLNSLCATMEEGRLLKALHYGLVLPNGTLQPGYLSVAFMTPKLRDGTDILPYVEQKLTRGENKSGIKIELKEAARIAIEQAPWSATQIAKALYDATNVVDTWPYWTLGASASASPVKASDASEPLTARQEARVREIVKEIMGK